MNPAPTPEDNLRAQAYALLGALLGREPDRGLLERLRGIDIPERSAGELAAAWRELQRAAREAEPENLRDEYFKLFIGLGRGEVVPYASWYRTGFLMEKPLAELRAELDRLGFERREQVCEPEDHAAALCDTMSLIIQAEDLPSGLQQGFFLRHLAPWIKRFFRDVQQAPSARFYHGVGRLGERFMDIEEQYLALKV